VYLATNSKEHTSSAYGLFGRLSLSPLTMLVFGCIGVTGLTRFLLSELLARAAICFVLAQSDSVCCPFQFHLEHVVTLFRDSEGHVEDAVFGYFNVMQ
jgi:hypothetical protein